MNSINWDTIRNTNPALRQKEFDAQLKNSTNQLSPIELLNKALSFYSKTERENLYRIERLTDTKRANGKLIRDYLSENSHIIQRCREEDLKKLNIDFQKIDIGSLRDAKVADLAKKLNSSSVYMYKLDDY